MRPLVASLALLVSGCATPKDVTQLEAELASAQDVIADLTARLDAMESRQRLVEAELVPSGDVPADAGALEEALAESRVDALEARAARAEIDINDLEAWSIQADNTNADQDLRLSLAVPQTVFDDTIATLTGDISERARIITTPTIIHIPSDMPSIQQALDSISDAVLAADFMIFVDTPACDTGTPLDPIIVSHPNGEHIRIIAADQARGLCTLLFSGDGAVSIAQGAALAEISGFDLRGQGTGTGISIQDNSTVFGALALSISNFGTGISASNGSLVIGADIHLIGNGEGMTASNNSTTNIYNSYALNNSGSGFRAVNGATMVINSTWSAGANFGYQAFTGGVLVAYDSSTCEDNDCSSIDAITGNTYDGYAATQSATIIAPGSQAYGNGRSGFSANEGSTMVASGSTSAGNAMSGFEATKGSTILARSSVANENTIYGYNINGGSHLEAGLATAYQNGTGFSIASGSSATLESAVARENRGSGAVISGASTADLSYCETTANEYYGVNVSTGAYADADQASAYGNGTARFNLTPNTSGPDQSYIFYY